MNHAGPPTAADEYLSIINQVHKTSIDPVPEEHDDDNPMFDTNDTVDEDELMADVRGGDNSEDFKKERGKGKLHPLITSDIW